MTSPFDANWHALTREAGLAAEHIAIGATALGRANYAQVAYYSQAFFALSVGFERSCKLALLLDYSIDNGAFPSENQVRRYGHRLDRLLNEASTIATKHNISPSLPSTNIHANIIRILGEFASNVTRYYNIDVLTGAAGGPHPGDPIASWNTDVTALILQAHYDQRTQARHESDAESVESLMGGSMRVIHTTETGQPIRTVLAGVRYTAQAEFARPWERMYVLQIGRFMRNVILKLSDERRSKGMVTPFLGEFYRVFNAKDSHFRSRKSWSIY
jgi:hypothetical protein